MLNRFRSYCLVTAVLVPALALLLGAGGPTLLYFCAVGPMPTMETVPAETSSVPPCHGAPVSSGDEAPVEEGTEGPALQACCTAVVAVPSHDGTTIEVASSISPRVVQLASFVAAASETPAPEPRDTGPPPLPVRPHLAFAVLLI